MLFDLVYILVNFSSCSYYYIAFCLVKIFCNWMFQHMIWPFVMGGLKKREFEYVPMDFGTTWEQQFYLLQTWVCSLPHRAKIWFQLMKIRLANGGFTALEVSQLLDSVIERFSDKRQLFLHDAKPLSVYPPSTTSHSHPTSAMWRTSATQYMTDLAVGAGYIPYHVSRSKADMHDGTRYFYNLKDLAIPFRHDDITDDHCLIFTDVDYYADMNRWMQKLRPILIYTLVPTRMCFRSDEYQFRIKDGKVQYHVSGGASYEHGLWDYTGDTIAVDLEDGSLATFSIEQRVIPGDEQHRFIILLPVARVPVPYTCLVPCAKTCRLKRKQLDDFLYDPITDRLSLLGKDAYHSVEITGSIYAAMTSRLKNKTASPVVADVERMLRDANISDAHIVAPLLFELLSIPLRRNVVLTGELTTNYHPIVPRLTTEDPKPTGTAASSALVSPGACFPSKSLASEKAMVKGRIERVKNSKTPPRVYKQYATEFIQLVVSRAGCGMPLEISDTIARQDKPMQKARNEQVKHTVGLRSTNRIQAFVKAEPYGTPNDPRVISTMDPNITMMMSAFTYAFKDEVLSKHQFYSPGKSPNEICDILAKISTGRIITTDFSRFDGTISKWLQTHIVRSAYMRWCHQSQRPTLDHWFNQVFISKAKTAGGLRYDPGWGTRSGSPITTDGNTLINAFIIFAAYLKLGLRSREAFSKLGLFCGDDGYNADHTGLEEAIKCVSFDLGLTVEVEVKEKGPFPYLGRLFIDPKTVPDSFQDMKRTLPKLHVVANGPESLEQRLTNKAKGYLVTDPKTPLLSTWANKVVELTGLDVKHATHEEEYKLQHPWPQTDPEAIKSAVCEQLGVDTTELEAMEEKIKSARSLSDIPVLFNWDTEVKIDCVRDGLVYTRGHVNSDNSNQINVESDNSSDYSVPCDGLVDSEVDTTVREEPECANVSKEGIAAETTTAEQPGRIEEGIREVANGSATIDRPARSEFSSKIPSLRKVIPTERRVTGTNQGGKSGVGHPKTSRTNPRWNLNSTATPSRIPRRISGSANARPLTSRGSG